MTSKKNNSENVLRFSITKEGSLGLLAYGDVGLRAWREKKSEFFIKDDINEEA